jgi:succinate-acetate transporter protein
MNVGLTRNNSGSYYFFGGLLLIIGGFLEFILGNTFPSVVFMSYGSFFLSFAATLQPFLDNAYGAYAPAGAASPAAGMATVDFTSSFALFLIFMAILSFVFLVLSIRTNIVFMFIFMTVVIFFSLMASVYWQTANGIGKEDAAALVVAHRLQVVCLTSVKYRALCK